MIDQRERGVRGLASRLMILFLLATFTMLATAQDAETPADSEPAAQASADPAVESTPESGSAAQPETDPPAESGADSDVPVQSLTGTLGLLVAPDFPPDRAELIYQPLIDYLNDVAGLDIELVVARNYHRYWLDARRNESPPLVFEEAHIAAWRMQEFGYEPLVATAQPQTYSLLTTGALADEPLSAFIGTPISSLPSPSLGYLMLARWYPNPLQQPLIMSTATSWQDVVEMVFSAEAQAAVAPAKLAARYPNLYPVATSEELPGPTLSASPDVPEDVRQRLIEALTTLHENTDHHAALFELDIDRFVPADPEGYEGLDEWLSSIFRI